MVYCIWCDDHVEDSVSWRSVFGISKPAAICRSCKEKLEKLSGPLCRICGRCLSGLDDAYKLKDLCYDCIRWEQSEWGGLLRKNRSLYGYNPFLKDVLALYKYRGDAAIAKGFALEWRQLYDKEFNGYYAVPIPLSSKRLYERGFNQSAELASLLAVPFSEHLERTVHEEKQSKKSRDERLAFNRSIPIFRSKKLPKELIDKEIVLIDDIYTTGTTVRRAAKALIDAGAGSVSSLTVARG